MTMEQFMDYARSFGYNIRFFGIGWAYITLNDKITLTESMSVEKAEYELALIGMAIMNDTIRSKYPEWGRQYR